MQSHKRIASPHIDKLDVCLRDIIVRRNSLTLQRDNFARRVHDGGVGGDRPPDRVGRVGHVDDDHLRSLAHLLPHANVPGKRGIIENLVDLTRVHLLVRLHGEGVEPNVCWSDPHICKLE